MYLLLQVPKLQRVDILLHVKYTVKEFETQLTLDILELIKREEDLIRRGRSDASLAGLRKRLANLFLQFVTTPEFNPEAANFQKVPTEEKQEEEEEEYTPTSLPSAQSTQQPSSDYLSAAAKKEQDLPSF